MCVILQLMRGIWLTTLTMAYRNHPNLGCLPPNMKPKTARNHIYETISSAFSRRSTSSPESPPFQGTSTHLSDSPTVGNASASANLASRGQRVYRSISSAFSMMSQHSPESPTQIPSTHLSGSSTASSTFSNGGRGRRIYQSISSVCIRHTPPVFDDSPETTPSTKAHIPAPDLLSIPIERKAENPPVLNWGHIDTMEEVDKRISEDCLPQPTAVISSDANGVQS